jgi:hypothetical protein
VNVRDAAELERIILARIDAVNRQLSMMWRVVSCLPRIDRATWGGGRDVSRTGRVHFRVHCRLCYRRLLESDLWHGRGASAGGFWRSRRLNIGIGCCARYKWPRGCRAAEQRDEVAPVHSITSSASARAHVGGASVLVQGARPIGHQTSCFDVVPIAVHRRQSRPSAKELNILRHQYGRRRGRVESRYRDGAL